MTVLPVFALGVDAGGSSTRWLLRRGDGPGASEEIARGRLAPLSGLSFLAGEGSEDARRAQSVVAALHDDVRSRLRQRTGTDRALDAVYAGVTGLSDGDAAATTLRTMLSARLDVAEERVRVVNDMALAYRCAFAPGEGVLVYAGTGSIAVHMDADGVLQRAGGHGYLIDDAGGGFWIGRQALRAVLREADRHGAPARGALADAVYAALGSRDWPDIRRRVYSGGRAEVAALVPAVRHALAASDPAADAIVAAAGRELARLADALMARLGGPLPVALAGGASGLGAPLRKAVVAGLPPGTRVHVAESTPVEAAARLALTTALDPVAIRTDGAR
ncbi:MAG: N-acetylglucosamine kinase, partial [Trueperaceae bacterium]